MPSPGRRDRRQLGPGPGDPNGVGSTLVNGINAAGDLVGFYTDAAGNTDGMLATP